MNIWFLGRTPEKLSDFYSNCPNSMSHMHAPPQKQCSGSVSQNGKAN